MIGKQLRLRRMLNENSNKSIVLPLDHGMTLGPIAGIENIGNFMQTMGGQAPNAYVLHRGELVRFHGLIPKGCGVFMHLSASIGFSPNREEKVLVGTVEEAVRLGADGVSIHVNLGNAQDLNMLRDAGKVAEACMVWGLPLLMMAYPKEPMNGLSGREIIERVGHCIRVCEELGADLVKVPMPAGDMDEFLDIVGSSSIPVLVAGGEKTGNDYIGQVKKLMSGKIAGLCVGRNVFQHSNPKAVLEELHAVVHGDYLYS